MSREEFIKLLQQYISEAKHFIHHNGEEIISFSLTDAEVDILIK